MAICATAGCPVIVQHGYCRACAALREHRRPNFDLRRLYRTARWRALRLVILQEEPLCVECEAEGHVSATEDVHHLVRARRETFFERSNLQALCHMHHSRHTQRGE